MILNRFVIIGFVGVGLIIGPLVFQESEQQSRLIIDQQVIKIAIFFNHTTANENQIRTYVTNILWPVIQTEASLKLSNNFDNYQIDKKLKVRDICVSPSDAHFGIEGSPCGRFMVYPKFWISGETDLRRGQLETGLHNFIFNDLRPIVRDALITQGAFDVVCKVQTPFGEFDCNGVEIIEHEI